MSLLAEGNLFVQRGDVRGAAAKYAEAKRIDSSLAFDPVRRARELAARPFREKAYNLARAGEITEAVAFFQKAKKIDSGLTIEPKVEARKVAAHALLYQARELARGDKTEEAVYRFKEARKLFPSLNIPADSEVKRLSAVRKIIEGRQKGRNGDTKAAVDLFTKAKAICPDLPIDPQKEERILAFTNDLRQGERLLRQGKTDKALQLYKKAEQIDKTAIQASSWNSLCWYGNIWGEARNSEVTKACERAVDLSYGNYSFHDSRGLNRALNNNFEGAIEDFEVFIKNEKDNDSRNKRMGWVKSLRTGKNPFSAEELENLRYE